MAKRSTLSDVARRAQVSVTTVSYVLNGRDSEMRITAATRDRVLRAAAELDYRSAQARTLAQPNPNAAGERLLLITDSVAIDPYAGSLLQGCFDEAAHQQRLLLLAEVGTDRNLEDQVLALVRQNAAGRAIYATRSTRQVHVADRMLGVPLVLLNCFDENPDTTAVIPDERGAGHMLGSAVLASGHKNGVFLVGGESREVLAAQQRAEGLREALRQAGTDLAGVINCDWWPESAELQVRRYLRLHTTTGDRPRVLVCQNERIAFGAYLALQDLALSVPNDVAVVTFEGSRMCGWMQPTLTSIDLPHYEMGRRAVELVLEAAAPAGVERVSATLRDRNSLRATTVGLAADA